MNRAWGGALSAVAALFGAVLCFSFGWRVGGAALGSLLALTGATMTALLSAALLDGLAALAGRLRRGPR